MNVKFNMFVINIIIKVAYISGKPGMCVSVGGHKCRWEVQVGRVRCCCCTDACVVGM